ncbi:MAG TPA: DegT/DnrJ/EryC1/StrS family aminotransferase [Acetobacteraceae bacterium]|nr:DegT/DnrJ/EryC1/StrS family aminotransferase [Acetobacteraceae bacterium]
MRSDHDIVSNFSGFCHNLPLMQPNPPRLSALAEELRGLEASGVLTNNGPLVSQLEQELTDNLFGGQGACVTVANATLGLMLALRLAAHTTGRPRGFALMPSFTFAAAAQAALWAGLTPLFCDIDAENWTASAAAEETLLRRYGDEITAIVPYATFGTDLDLGRYRDLERSHGVAVVVDAAASLGTRDKLGRGFATESRLMTVFSMHATKPFAVAEGGLVYSADRTRIATLRRMANFGLDDARSAELPGLNAKMSEVTALMALAKLGEIESISNHRARLAARYQARLPNLTFQAPAGLRQAHAFMPVLLPPNLAPRRAEIRAALGLCGIGTGTYFSPHLAEQKFFRTHCRAGDLAVTEEIAARVLALPLTDDMTVTDIDTVADALAETLRTLTARRRGVTLRGAA